MITKGFLGVDYSYDRETGRWLINGKDGSELAEKTFFKYYALSNNSVDALTHLYVYGTHPAQLNDPLDCDEDIIKFDDVECIRIFWDKLYPDICQYYKNKLNEIIKFTQYAYKTWLYRRIGVLSLTDSAENIPMWSSYTEHKGFCVEFDLASFPHKKWGPFPINYQKEIIPICIKDSCVQIATLIQTNVKLESWSYENESRLLLEAPTGWDLKVFGKDADKYNRPDDLDRKFKYPLESIKSVTLGAKFFVGGRTNICTYEMEYVATNEIQEKLLDFLAYTKIPVFELFKKGLKVERVRLEIRKIRNNAYIINNY